MVLAMASPYAPSLRLPADNEIAVAIDALQKMKDALTASTGIHRIVLTTEPGDQQTIQVPAIAMRLLGEVLCEISLGHAVKVVALRAELTTQEAADLLDVSRPSLVKLLSEGAIPYEKRGSHRRLKLVDVMAYKHRRDEANLAAIETMAAQAQKLKMGYE